MQDPAFKRLFRHPVTIEKLIRTYAPEHAERIDYSTLRPLDGELVGEALVRRYPDMLWTARTHEAGVDVLILVEFQGTHDSLMALRMAVYQLLAVQELLRRSRSSGSGRSLVVLPFVIYHGKGRWKAPTRLRKLFPQWVPGDYRVVSRNPGGAKATAVRGDLTRTILRLERERSVESALAALAELSRIAEDTGSEYDRFMAECVGEMLVSRKRITRRQMREARTMAQVSTAYALSWEEFGKRRFRQGRDEGVRQGRDEGIRQGRDEGIRQGRDEGIRRGREDQAAMVREQVREKFGAEAAEELAALLGETPDARRLLEAASAVIASATVEELLGRVRSRTGAT